ncbi:response regulator transcription factor [Oscillospiraceae bacterium MB08-C2-2]|nr:response regulator transcription factor [Oscillospiraceae bacterium MB08-C2-2]
MSDKIRFMLVEDDQDFIFLVRRLAECEPDLELVCCAGGREDALQLCSELQPDIVLMDLCLSTAGLEGIEISREICRRTDAAVIILTSHENPHIVVDSCVKSMASGYIFKSQFNIIAETIRKTLNGHTPQLYLINSLILAQLSPAERTVFDAIIDNDTYTLSSHKTIANQKTSIYKKLGIKNQGELLHLWLKRLR